MPPETATSGLMQRWRSALARLALPGVALACAWCLYNLPGTLREGSQGAAFVFQVVFGPTIASTLLVVALALVQAARLQGRGRGMALVAAAMSVPALSLVTVIVVMTETGVWPAAPLPSPVLLWANFGSSAMICIGAAIILDQREQSAMRTAALREARLRAADVVRRTAEVRLQAERARVEPRFLFDALSAVERVYDADTAAGNALLDHLVAYLRAVLPDLREASPSVDRDAEIARLRAAVERFVASVQPSPREARS